MPVHKRIAIARETLEIFAPLAHRLGMWSFGTELSDLAFKYLFPQDFAKIESYIDSKVGRPHTPWQALPRPTDH